MPLWRIRSVEPTTRKKITDFAHNERMTVAKALAKIVEMALGK